MKRQEGPRGRSQRLTRRDERREAQYWADQRREQLWRQEQERPDYYSADYSADDLIGMHQQILENTPGGAPGVIERWGPDWIA